MKCLLSSLNYQRQNNHYKNYTTCCLNLNMNPIITPLITQFIWLKQVFHTSYFLLSNHQSKQIMQ